MKFIDEMDLSGKVVLLRLNLNVPIKNGEIVDDTRIKEVIPTIEYCKAHAKKTVIIAHLGRPGGKVVSKLSLKPVAEYLHKVYSEDFIFLTQTLGDKVEKAINVEADGSIILLENLRFQPEERANDESFGKELSSLGDVFINDAFGDSAKDNASVMWPPEFLPSAGGFRLREELHHLNNLRDNPKNPLVVIIGGTKISDKMGVITGLGDKAEKILLGGAVANTVLAAQGIDVKESYYKPDEIDAAKEILLKFGHKLVVPSDALVMKSIDNEFKPESLRLANVNELEDGEAILDIGTKTIENYSSICSGANAIYWAGPLGYIELDATAEGSIQLLHFIVRLEAYKAAGGGETSALLKKANVINKMDFVSTGGGASLKLLSGEILPGLAALDLQ